MRLKSDICINEMNIVLVGYRCSGKTTVGKILAQDLGMDFIDTDQVIEKKTGLSISNYVSQNGWVSFRRMERKVIKKLSLKDNLIIATGGGVVIDRDNVKNLKQKGWLVWLKADASVITERMRKEEKSGKSRPALSGVNPLREIDKVLDERMKFYERASDYIVDTNSLVPEEVAVAILSNPIIDSAGLRCS